MNILFRKPVELLKIEFILCDQILNVRKFIGGGIVVVRSTQYLSLSYAIKMLAYNDNIAKNIGGPDGISHLQVL